MIWRRASGGRRASSRAVCERCRQHLAVRHDLADEAHRERLGGADRLAGEAEPHRLELADRAGQALGAAGARHDADADLGLAELCAFARDQDVAAHRELEAAAERIAVDRGDHRLRRARHGLPVALGAPAHDLDGPGVDELPRSAPAAKAGSSPVSTIARTAGSSCRRLERLGERLAGREVQRVAHLGPVDPHERHAVVGPLDQHEPALCCHVTTSRYVRAQLRTIGRDGSMIDFARDEATIGVVGAGAMGQGIAQVALEGGLSLVLHDAREGAAGEGLEKVFARLARRVEKGELAPGALATMRSRASARRRPRGLRRLCRGDRGGGRGPRGQAGGVRRARGGGRRAMPARLEHELAADRLDRARLPAARAHRRHALLQPVPLMRLVEIVRSLDTSDATVAALMALGRRMGRTPVVVRDSPGFLVNLGGRAFTTEALRLLDEGVATPAQIDAILKDCGGFRMGPFELMDLTGMDVNCPVSRIVFEAFQNDPRLKTTPHHKLLVDAGRLGRKSGIGHYRYDARGRMRRSAGPRFRAGGRAGRTGARARARERLAELLTAAGIEALRRRRRRRADRRRPARRGRQQLRAAPRASITAAWSRST